MDSKVDNLKRQIYIILFLLLLIPIGFSYDFDFSSNETLLTENLAHGIKAYNRPSDGNWYIVTSYGGDIQIDVFNEDFSTNLDSSSYECSDYPDTCSALDCTTKYNLTLGYGFECLGEQDLSNNYNSIIFIPFSDIDSGVYLANGGQSTSSTYRINYPAVSSSALKLWKRGGSDGDLKYTIYNSVGSTDLGDGNFDLPSSYENIDDMQLVDCGGMYNVLIMKNGKVYDLIYDYSRNYKNVYLFSPVNWDTDDITHLFNGWCDEEENSLYFVLTNTTTDYGNITIQRWNTGVYSLSNVWTEILSQNEIEPLTNGTNGGYYIQKPFIIRDRYDRFNLFYNFVISGSDNQLRVSSESDCFCSNWINTSECSDSYIKQTRSCSPNECSDEIQYIESDYCEREFNRTQGIYSQQTTKYWNQSSCITRWVNTGEGIATCSPEPILIPSDCININSTFESTPEFESYTIFRDPSCSQGSFHLTTCNPTYDCFSQNFSCEQINVTQTDLYNSYSAGDFATGKGEMRVDSVCKCQFTLFKYGMKRFRLRNSLTIECEITCKEEWFCLNEDYKSLRHIDCSETNVTLCNYDCKNGNCLTSGESDSTPISPDFWLNFFINPEKPANKLFISIIGSILFGSIAVFIMGDKKHSVPVFFLLFFAGIILFIVLGWIPPILIIIIIFGIGIWFYLKNTGK